MQLETGDWDINSGGPANGTLSRSYTVSHPNQKLIQLALLLSLLDYSPFTSIYLRGIIKVSNVEIV